MTINTYLNFDGKCEEAFQFYQSVLGGEFGYTSRFSEMPKEFKIHEKDFNKIMHTSLIVNVDTILMGSDSIDKLVIGNNFSISLNAVSKEEADSLFNGLSFGGLQIMPMRSTFWGSYFGMLTDKFGIQWMVSFDEIKK